MESEAYEVTWEESGAGWWISEGYDGFPSRYVTLVPQKSGGYKVSTCIHWGDDWLDKDIADGLDLGAAKVTGEAWIRSDEG